MKGGDVARGIQSKQRGWREAAGKKVAIRHVNAGLSTSIVIGPELIAPREHPFRSLPAASTATPAFSGPG